MHYLALFLDRNRQLCLWSGITEVFIWLRRSTSSKTVKSPSQKETNKSHQAFQSQFEESWNENGIGGWLWLSPLWPGLKSVCSVVLLRKCGMSIVCGAEASGDGLSMLESILLSSRWPTGVKQVDDWYILMLLIVLFKRPSILKVIAFFSRN